VYVLCICNTFFFPFSFFPFLWCTLQTCFSHPKLSMWPSKHVSHIQSSVCDPPNMFLTSKKLSMWPSKHVSHIQNILDTVLTLLFLATPPIKLKLELHIDGRLGTNSNPLGPLKLSSWSGTNKEEWINMTSVNPVHNTQVCYFNNVWLMFLV